MKVDQCPVCLSVVTWDANKRKSPHPVQRVRANHQRKGTLVTEPISTELVFADETGELVTVAYLTAEQTADLMAELAQSLAVLLDDDDETAGGAQ